MKKCINLYISEFDTKEKIKMIKAAGFEGIYPEFNTSKENLNFGEIVYEIRKQGLIIPMVHSLHKGLDVLNFWKEDKISMENGDFIETLICFQLEIMNDLQLDNLIIHTHNTVEVINSPTGLDRLRRILKICEKYNINICIENLYSATQLKYIFDNIKSKNLKMCLDSGHQHLNYPNASYTDLYAPIINTLHLHDNHSVNDDHLPLGFGQIDIYKLSNSILTLDNNINLSLETKTKPENFTQTYLNQCYQSLINFEELIEKARKNTK